MINFIRTKNVPGYLVLIIDIIVIVFSLWLAYLLRFNFSIPKIELDALPILFPIILMVRFSTFVFAKSYQSIIRHTGTHDIIRVFVANIIGSLIFLMIDVVSYYFVNGKILIPLSIVILEFMISTFIIWIYRVSIKMAYLEYTNPSRIRQRVIIYGAGAAGLNSKSAIDRDAGLKYKVIAFIDDDSKKAGKRLEDVTIFPYEKLDALLENQTVAHVIIAIQNISQSKKKQIVDKCYARNVKVLIVPPVSKWINGELSFKQIKRVKIEDLLERDEIQFDKHLIKKFLTGKNILVTGAAGSIGSEIVRQLLAFKYKKLILLDNAETPLYYLNNELSSIADPKTYQIVIGDICHAEKMENIFRDEKIDVVFNAAAYKHVPMMEENPSEAVKVNVGGTKILADLAIKYKVNKFVMISTDKAVNPTSVMGASKRVAEMYIQTLNKKLETSFVTTRFGNVLGSNGSVIPLFREQIEKGGPITITHAEVTRFFMTIPEACRLVLVAGSLGKGGEIFMFDMGVSVKIVDLAKKMIRLSGLTLGKDIQIKYTGLRPGEKLYEELLADAENTIPTSHQQILLAKVRDYEFDEISPKIDALISENCNLNVEIVSKMKEMVPEYKSQNSIYEELDLKKQIN